MRAKKKSGRHLSHETRVYLHALDEYITETGISDVDMVTAARWAISKGHIKPEPQDEVRRVARRMARAAREDYIDDENGEPVRVRYPYPIQNKDGEGQLVFRWFKLEDATPEKMRLAAQHKRRGIAAAVFQAERDVAYYNKHYNPGEPIEIDWNLNADVAERQQSGEYDDMPPEDYEI